MNNEKIILKYFKELNNKKLNSDFVIDKSGVKCVEILSAKIEKLNPLRSILDFKIKKTNEEYCKKELDWYLSQSLSIINYVDDVKIWNYVCTKDNKKEINSNYGWCIFSKKNYFQYQNCLNELLNNIESRRAEMIYTRPSMWVDYNKNGMSDFCCTDGVQCFIRNNKLYYIVKQRSCDIIYGFFNDFYWHCYVYNKLYNDLKQKYSCLLIGEIIYNAYSLHCYEKHFKLLNDIINNYENKYNEMA